MITAVSRWLLPQATDEGEVEEDFGTSSCASTQRHLWNLFENPHHSRAAKVSLCHIKKRLSVYITYLRDAKMMDKMLFFIECCYNANTNDQNPSVIICFTITMISFAKPQVQPSLSCALLLAEPIDTEFPSIS